MWHRLCCVGRGAQGKSYAFQEKLSLYRWGYCAGFFLSHRATTHMFCSVALKLLKRD